MRAAHAFALGFRALSLYIHGFRILSKTCSVPLCCAQPGSGVTARMQNASHGPIVLQRRQTRARLFSATTYARLRLLAPYRYVACQTLLTGHWLRCTATACLLAFVLDHPYRTLAALPPAYDSRWLHFTAVHRVTLCGAQGGTPRGAYVCDQFGRLAARYSETT